GLEGWPGWRGGAVGRVGGGGGGKARPGRPPGPRGGPGGSPPAGGWQPPDQRWPGRRRRWRHGPPRWARGPRDHGPLRRAQEDRLAGGIAAGLSRRTGIDGMVIRTALVVGTLLTGGLLAVLFLSARLIVPAPRA